MKRSAVPLSADGARGRRHARLAGRVRLGGRDLSPRTRKQPAAPADGTQLPKPDPAFKGKIGETYKDSTPDYPQPVKAPEGQPERAAHPARRRRLRHVLDVRRAGADAAHGQAREQRAEVHPLPHHGPVQPDARRRCSPAATITACGTGVIIEMGTGYPGYTGIIPQEHGAGAADAARQRLRHGHVRQVAQHAGAGDQPGRSVRPLADRPGVRLLLRLQPGRNAPVLSRRSIATRRPVPQPKIARAGLPLHRGHDRRGDRLDAATCGPPTRTSRGSSTSAPSGVHAPHHAPKEWRDKYKGKFDHGWDKQRELTHAKQLEMGIIPKGTKLTPRPKEIPAWDDQLGGREEGLHPADGELRRRTWRTPTTRSAG